MTGPERARKEITERINVLESLVREATGNADYHATEVTRWRAAAAEATGASLILEGLLAQLNPPDGLGK